MHDDLRSIIRLRSRKNKQTKTSRNKESKKYIGRILKRPRSLLKKASDVHIWNDLRKKK
jgi:hypothetical protein